MVDRATALATRKIGDGRAGRSRTVVECGRGDTRRVGQTSFSAGGDRERERRHRNANSHGHTVGDDDAAGHALADAVQHTDDDADGYEHADGNTHRHDDSLGDAPPDNDKNAKARSYEYGHQGSDGDADKDTKADSHFQAYQDAQANGHGNTGRELPPGLPRSLYPAAAA